MQRANPADFCIALVTIEGHVYEVGDSAVPFTIQSVSKAFVFALHWRWSGGNRNREIAWLLHNYAVIQEKRSADVWANTAVACLELPLDGIADYRQLHPQIAIKIMRNLSALLARRLILANAKAKRLSAY